MTATYEETVLTLPYVPQDKKEEHDIVERLKEWFKSPDHLLHVIRSNRFAKIFTPEGFARVYQAHKQTYLGSLQQLNTIGQERNEDHLFGDILKGLVQKESGQNISFKDPGFKLLLSLIRRKRNHEHPPVRAKKKRRTRSFAQQTRLFA